MSKLKSRHETTMRAPGRVDETLPVESEGSIGAAEEVFENFAADLGRFLGNVQNRADTWLQQRQHIADQLTKIRDTASQYLRQLTGTGAAAPTSPGSPRRGRPRRRGSRKAAGGSARRRGRHMSEEARARIAAAQKKRWAEYRKNTRTGTE